MQAEQVAGSVVQALVFAELHRRNGLPPGRQGFAMLFVWSMALGFLRLRTGRGERAAVAGGVQERSG